jgi:predicted dehydrogenase
VSEKVRVAVIGAGQMANRVHYPSLASLEEVDLVAACDLDRERLERTAGRWGIEGRFTDYREMVDRSAPDAVYAIGQPHVMYDIWTWCLEQGLDLFIEKPMGITLHQARSLAHLAQRHGCVTQVGFQRRSSPLAVTLRDECLRRGPIEHAVCRFYKNAIDPFLGARDHMLDDGVHAVDTLRWMCDGEVVRIQSVTRRLHVPDLNFIAALLSFDNGATGVLLNSWASGRRVFSVEMHAPGVCAEIEPEVGGVLYADGDTEGVRHDARRAAGSDELYVFGGFRAKSREFVRCVRERSQPGSSFADAVRTMEVAERILAQDLLSAGEEGSAG